MSRHAAKAPVSWEEPLLSPLDFTAVVEGAVLDTLHDRSLTEEERALVTAALGRLAQSAIPMLTNRGLIRGQHGRRLYARLVGLDHRFQKARRAGR